MIPPPQLAIESREAKDRRIAELLAKLAAADHATFAAMGLADRIADMQEASA